MSPRLSLFERTVPAYLKNLSTDNHTEKTFDQRILVVDLMRNKDPNNNWKNGNVYIAKVGSGDPFYIPVDWMKSLFVNDRVVPRSLFDFVDKLVNIKTSGVKKVMVITNSEREANVRKNFVKEGVEILNAGELDRKFAKVRFRTRPNYTPTQLDKALHVARWELRNSTAR